ncbi:DUF202 domain-containing protein [Actinomycetospora aeridis]|uniref:DUF202 domain-containing protein n=1 Tax=Actinomycetospora aeridis TaxID=3129231 RepID=A0ABU8N1R5_9PSEU
MAQPAAQRQQDLDDDGPDLRWVLAAERTLLAWFRLSLALFLVGVVPLVLVPPGTATVLVTVVSGGLMIAGGAAAVEGLRRWRRGQSR